MFGHLDPPKPNLRSTPHPVPLDIHYPTIKPGYFAHAGRAPNTDYHYKILQYKQRKEADFEHVIKREQEKSAKDLFLITFDQHTENRRFRGEIQKRLNLRMEEYEAAIDIRREKLKDLLAAEEREFYRETVDVAQRGNETRMDEMKQRSVELIAQREADRLEIVKEKRLQQYMNRCVDLRGALEKKNLIERKHGNLQQIRENEAKREVEREIDHMWNELSNKEVLAKKEREEQEAIERYKLNRQTKDTLDLQIKGKELLQQEIKRVTLEDRIELEKLSEEMKKEQIEALIQKRKDRDECDRILREQLEVQEKFRAQRKKEEDALETAFVRLVQLELEKERAKVVDSATAAKREFALYQQHILELEEQRRSDDRLLNKLLDEYRKDIERKQDEAKCLIEKARRKLQKDVLQGRQEQIAYKKIIAEEELKMKQDENELARYAYEVNNRLDAEMAKQEKLAKLQYKEDLVKQIEYQKILQQREKEELERQLEVGKQEEERYQKLISDMCSGKIVIKTKHPFRRLIENYDCHCPEATSKLQ